nr:MAG TPA: hypothetical protein [Caudoviricetes sp.]DAE36590.1 MAG TPA: hypothetical protein [Caudoviricetes sp.]DAG21387.1 MAG TPA: hypothetical protein [Bacteriophage sp.]DAP93177.1 MAG TPA: hypothetical protein [Caudoviricetes sp.]
MSRKRIVVPLSESGIQKIQDELTVYRKWQEEKARELAERLASLGATVASIRFSRAVYTGPKDVDVTVEELPNGYKVKADGESVLFIEFGSGVTYGYGHPEAGEFGMGPGTYPDGKGHWDDPKGWYLPKSAGGGHTFGNPPAMPMYEARKAIEQELPRIVKEVFG